MTQLLSAIIEAWEEIKINRLRIILSLIGVGAAVWAMATTLALGSLITASSEMGQAQWQGRTGTVSVSAFPDSQPSFLDPHFFEPSFDDEEEEDPAPIALDENGRPVDPFGDAVMQTVSRTGATIWTRDRLIVASVQAPGYNEADACDPMYGCDNGPLPEIRGIDPDYFDIYYRPIVRGRGLTQRDGQLQMNPAVINEWMWKAMGSPDLAGHPRVRLLDHQKVAFTVVGVVQNELYSHGPQMFIHYDTFTGALPPKLAADSESYSFSIMAPSGQQENAQAVMVGTLKAQLGNDYEVEGNFDPDRNQSREDGTRTVQVIISVIGGIVILLGALGLLTVSIVTVSHRVREIGIRRAMGASGRRIFFSVFLESVVATTVAGLIGVMLSILTIRLAPLEKIDILVPPGGGAYPMTAAFIGLVISAAVGALCGVIPASIAVRIKPIDAIRF